MVGPVDGDIDVASEVVRKFCDGERDGAIDVASEVVRNVCDGERLGDNDGRLVGSIGAFEGQNDGVWVGEEVCVGKLVGSRVGVLVRRQIPAASPSRSSPGSRSISSSYMVQPSAFLQKYSTHLMLSRHFR